METLQSRIKSARTRRKKSQRWLAHAIGVSSPAVTGWESGKKTPTLDNLSAIAVLLEVSFEWLATGRGTMELHIEQALPFSYPVSPEWQETLNGIEQLPAADRDELRRFIDRVVLKKPQ